MLFFRIVAKVGSIYKGDVMSLVKFTVSAPHEMASAPTAESVEELGLRPGEALQRAIKAIRVLPVKE